MSRLSGANSNTSEMQCRIWRSEERPIGIYIQSRCRKPISAEPSLNILLLSPPEQVLFLNLELFLYDKLYGQIPKAIWKGLKQYNLQRIPN